MYHSNRSWANSQARAMVEGRRNGGFPLSDRGMNPLLCNWTQGSPPPFAQNWFANLFWGHHTPKTASILLEIMSDVLTGYGSIKRPNG